MSIETYYSVLTEAVKAQGTIDRAQKRLNEAKSGVSHELFMAAQDTAAHDVDLFLSFCTEAEAQYKASKKRAKVVIPKQWSQAKSNIKAALNFGLNLKDYPTESAMRKALLDARKEQAGGDLFATLKQLVSKADKLGHKEDAVKAVRDAESVVEVMLALAEKEAAVKEQAPARKITAAA